MSTDSVLVDSISCFSITTRTPTWPTCKSILQRGWLHPGSIVVADNVKVPGAPKYREFMRQQQGKAWNTVEHKTHLEYQITGRRPGAGVGVPGRHLGGAWVRPGPHFPQCMDGDQGVDLRGGHRGVAEQLLHHPHIGAALQQVRGKRMPQHVR